MASPQEKPLFEQFSPNTKEEWLQEALKKQKNPDFEALFAHNLEGISLPPFFTPEDSIAASLAPSDFAPQPGWQTWEEVLVQSPAQALEESDQALKMGAHNILFRLSQELRVDDLQSLFSHIQEKEYTPFYFPSDLESFQNLRQISADTPQAPALIWDALGLLSLGHLSMDNWQEVMPSREQLEKALASSQAALYISGEHFHQAGANATQDLAFSLAMLVEYVNQASDQGLSPSECFSLVQWSVATGNQYFIEIAKLRAWRLLWKQVLQAYEVDEQAAFILGRNSSWHRSPKDVYNNMLRATTEAMAAVIGGAQAFCPSPYHQRPEDAFARRIARNVSSILQDEAHINKVLDASAGSYYIEYLTQELAQKSWSLFQEVEALGGYVGALQKGFIREQVEKTAQIRRERFEAGHDIMVGVNQYPNPEDPAEAPHLQTASASLPDYALRTGSLA